MLRIDKTLREFGIAGVGGVLNGKLGAYFESSSQYGASTRYNVVRFFKFTSMSCGAILDPSDLAIAATSTEE